MARAIFKEKDVFHGSIVALVTPFKDGAVDLTALGELVEYHIDSGTHAIVAAGTTGESGTLSHDEKLLVLKTIIEIAKERIPVIAGTAMNSTQDCIQLTHEAMSCGAHAALIMTPSYIKPTQAGLFEHYQAIATSVHMPIILYNVPGRTACDLLPETVIKLADISNIIGIKEATGDLSRLEQIHAGTQGRMDIYSGDDPTACEWMLNGAKGVISVTANVAAKRMAKLAEACLDQELELASQLQADLLPLHEALFVESNPIPVKWALAKRGLIKNELRLPLTPLEEKHQTNLNVILEKLDLCA